MSEGQPLAGLRVIDLSIARAGPTAVRQLADWGAEVIRIELPGDDQGVVLDHLSSDYINLHTNKRAMTLNLKTQEGRALLFELLDDADVLVENFRTPVKHKLGIAYDDVATRCPRLIYGSIAGFGQEGPKADRGAVDQIIQGEGGLMSITGTPESGPVRAGIAVADLAAGILLANGILLALIERDRSGQGQWVRVSLLEALISFLDFQAVRWIADSEDPDPVGNDHPTLAPMGTFTAADGFLNLAAPSDRLWVKLCAAIDAPHLADDDRYASAPARLAHRAELTRDLQEVLVRRPRAEWIAALDAVGVPCGPVNTIAEVFADEQVAHLEMAATVEHPVRGAISVLRNPITMSRTSPVRKRSSPTAGADTSEILAELGRTPEQIADLRAKGVI